MPDEVSRHVHRGLTIADIADTALSLQLAEASDLILAQLARLESALTRHALRHRHTPRVGRSHGQYATVDVWGHRVADFAFAARRARDRVRTAREEVAVAKISGASGTYPYWPPAVEENAAHRLGLGTVEVASQIVMRDRLANWVCVLALSVSLCEAVALEIRLGHQAEVAEVAEGLRVSPGAPLSPKPNSITCEHICGLAQVVRGYVTPVMAGMALWHERDHSHLPAERLCIPDAAALTEHVVRATAGIIESLYVDVGRDGRQVR